MKQPPAKITVKTTRGEQTVSGQPVQGAHLFAIAPSVGHDERWTLTHLPTGYRVTGASTQSPLKAIAVRLMAVPTATTTDLEAIKADGAAWKAIIRESLGQCRYCGIAADDPRAAQACVSTDNPSAFHDFGGK